MKNRISILIIAFVMLLSLPVWAGTAGSGSGDQTQTQSRLQDQDQTQDQTRLLDQDQTQDQTRLLDQARLQLRDRLQIADSAKTMQQERRQSLEQAGAGNFADVQQHWAREQIASAYQWGFTNGYQDGTFKPDGTISGAEGIIMMGRLMNCMNAADETGSTVGAIDLNDVPVWAREMIQEQTALRIAAQSRIYGEDQMNRLQFAITLAKALKLEATPVSGGNEIFLDQKNLSEEDLGYVNSLRILGVVLGSDGNFSPEKPVSRAEAASMLMRVVAITE